MVPHPEGCLAVAPRPPLLLLLSDITNGTSLTITETTLAQDSGCPPAGPGAGGPYAGPGPLDD